MTENEWMFFDKMPERVSSGFLWIAIPEKVTAHCTGSGGMPEPLDAPCGCAGDAGSRWRAAGMD